MVLLINPIILSVVCSVARPFNGSEDGADLVLNDTDLTAFFRKSSCSRLHLNEKSMRFVSKQGHLQPRLHSKARQYTFFRLGGSVVVPLQTT